jgi:spermidine synthase
MRKSDALFFLTGAAALVYQTVWIRLAGRLFGSDAGGLTLVLAVFMGGMALGALWAAPLARGAHRPVRLFALLEVGLGLWAALSPALFELTEPVAAGALRVFLAVLFLLPPTLVMGATFPLMARLTIRTQADTGSETSAFYGANTLGAACGALLGPLALMPLLGLSGALWAAALLDFAAAGLALRWLVAPERVGDAREGDAQANSRDGASLGFDPLLVGTLLVGLCGLGLEVVLSRLLLTVTGSSVYAYAIVLAVFLAGIGLGSRQLVVHSPRSGRGGLRADARTFALAALWLPALTLFGLCALRWQLGERDLFGALQNRMPTGAGVARLWASHALFAALALLPPALALGAALPAAAAAHAERWPASRREGALARVYTFNTTGALLGTVLAGFVLLPRLGPQASLLPLLVLAWCAGALIPGRTTLHLGLSAAAALAFGLLLQAGSSPAPGASVLYLEHDAHATVGVEESRESSGELVRSLRVNGKVVATTAPVDLRLQRLLGQVPGLLHGRVRRALVIGLGTGMTAGSLLDLPGLERLDVFEISSAVPGAARQFASWNGGVLEDARTHLALADGRHALATSEERWDLVTSDPIHPWTRGSSDLYALEHFESMEAHLAPGGVASQWLPLYQLSTLDVQTVIATWCAAFPHTSAWLTAYDLALVGSREPLAGLAASPARIPVGALGTHLAEAGVHSIPELAALQVADDSDLRAFAQGVAPMRDDRPVLEFRAPFSFLRGYATEVLGWAAREEFVERLQPEARERARAVRATLRRFLDELPGGWTLAAQRYGEALLALPPLD